MVFATPIFYGLVSVLPATLQFLTAMLACLVNERMQRKLDSPQEEVRILKEHFTAVTGKRRISLTDQQRLRLAIKGKGLSPKEQRECCQLVKPGTILAWFRRLLAKKSDSSR